MHHRCSTCVHCMAKVCNCHQKLVRRSPKLWKTIGNFRFPLRHFRCIKVCIAEATGPRLGSRINPCTLSCTPLRKADRALRINTPGCTESISLLESQFLYYRVNFFTTESKSLLQSQFLYQAETKSPKNGHAKCVRVAFDEGKTVPKCVTVVFVLNHNTFYFHFVKFFCAAAFYDLGARPLRHSIVPNACLWKFMTFRRRSKNSLSKKLRSQKNNRSNFAPPKKTVEDSRDSKKKKDGQSVGLRSGSNHLKKKFFLRTWSPN